MTKTLLIGSGNLDKVNELRELLADSGWRVAGLGDFDEVPEPEETETTFEGNALLKARYYSERFDVPCVADDSGIEVDALDGAPGVYSARYAGETCTYDDNNQKLVAALSDIAEPDRGARFVCVAAYADPSGQSHTVRGTVEGRIAAECRGNRGFGYDPLFIAGEMTMTFAEIQAAQKAAVSHRGRAFRQMAAFLSLRAAKAS